MPDRDEVISPGTAQPQPASPAQREAFDSALLASTASFGVAPDAAQRDRMWSHFRAVVETNRQFNLTRITSPTDAAVKHYADSLCLLAASGIERNRPLQVLDVGTGAGFPAIPLAIMCQAWRVTAIDGTGKKARFLADTIAAMAMTNVTARHVRAADLAKVSSDSFDLVLLRAVGKVAEALAEVRTLAKMGGEVVFYKTVNIGDEELAGGLDAADSFGFEALPLEDVVLTAPEGPLHRRFVRYRRLSGQQSKRRWARFHRPRG